MQNHKLIRYDPFNIEPYNFTLGARVKITYGEHKGYLGSIKEIINKAAYAIVYTDYDGSKREYLVPENRHVRIFLDIGRTVSVKFTSVHVL